MQEFLCNFDDFFFYIPNLARDIRQENIEACILYAQRFQLAPKLGQAFYLDILQNQLLPDYIELLNGGTFVNCDGNTQLFYGLKPAIIHLAFAEFSLKNQYKITDSGIVNKNFDFSEGVKKTERNEFAVDNQNIAGQYLTSVFEYLNENKDKFPLWKGCFKDVNNASPYIISHAIKQQQYPNQ